jgi:hypothetical protein
MMDAMRELIAGLYADNWQMRVAPLLQAVERSVIGPIVISLVPSRSFFVGHGGWCGIAEGEVEAGDQLAVLFPGADVPFVIREKADCYEMVGTARTPSDSLTTGDIWEFTFV